MTDEQWATILERVDEAEVSRVRIHPDLVLDVFAMAALVGLLVMPDTKTKCTGSVGTLDVERLARESYSLADAMMARRTSRRNGE